MKKAICITLGVLMCLCSVNPLFSTKDNRGRNNKTVELNMDKVQLKVGESVELEANQSVTWKSNNEKVATVDKNGVVTAKKEGNAIIIARNKKGKAAKCKVTVSGENNNNPQQPSNPENPNNENLIDINKYKENNAKAKINGSTITVTSNGGDGDCIIYTVSGLNSNKTYLFTATIVGQMGWSEVMDGDKVLYEGDEENVSLKISGVDTVEILCYEGDYTDLKLVEQGGNEVQPEQPNIPEQPVIPEQPEQPSVPEQPSKPDNGEEVNYDKLIGFNRSVWSTDPAEVADRVREMKVNELTLSVKFNIDSLTSNNVTVDKADLNRAKQIMADLDSDGTLDHIKVIFEPYPYINSGEEVETTFNPSNDTVFLNNWQNCINSTLKEFDEYEFWGVYVNSNMDSLMDNVDKWQDIYDGVKELQPNANVMVRTNWWWSDYDEPEYNGYGLNTRKNHAYYKIWDVLAIASYFELADTKSATEDQIYGWLVNGTTIWDRNQKIVEEIEELHKATGKPIFFGELGCPSKTYAMKAPYDVDCGTQNDQATQANLFKAYYRAFKDKDWWLGFSVYAVGDDGNYDITGKQAGNYITSLNARETFNK